MSKSPSTVESDTGPQPPVGPVSPWRATGQESPVFFDDRGRRGVVARVIGIVGGLVSVGALAVIVTGAMAFVRVSPVAKRATQSLAAQVARRPAADADRQLGALRGAGRRAGDSEMASGRFAVHKASTIVKRAPP